MVKRLLLVPVAVLGLLFLAGCANDNAGNSSGDTPPPPPKNDIQLIPGQTGDIQFSYFIMEFQPVVAGDTVIAKYPFKNVSERSVTIDNVAKSCYCLSVDYPKKVNPGQIGEITVKFATEGQAKEVPTTHEKMFPVFINGEQLPLETLRLTGRVMPAPTTPVPAP